MTSHRLLRRLALLTLLAAAGAAPAQTAPATPPLPPPPPAADASVPTLEGMTVSGEQPGPGLWKVTRGDHTLLILGTLTPLPKNMTWRTTEIDDALSHADALILPSKVQIKPNVGFFGRLALLPSLIGVRNAPDDKTLQQSVPADVYARWLTVKSKYIGDDRKVERYRPIFAVLELYKQAVRKSGLARSGGVTRTVMDLADKHGVKQVPVEYTLLVDDPRAAVKSFKQSTLDDTSCFAQSIDNIDTQLADMARRANAWATGDIAALDDQRTAKQRETCMSAATDSGVAQKIGLTDVPRAVRDLWMHTVDTAMATNHETVAIVPLDDLLGPDGYLAALKARGYGVASPDDDDN